MKVLILFAALFASVHSRQVQDKTECFRTIFRECVKDATPLDRLTLCDELKNTLECVSLKALECRLPFWRDATDLSAGAEIACIFKETFDKDKACYLNVINDNECVEPIREAMKDYKTNEDVIRANKKICNLFEPYSNCVQKKVEKNCHNADLELFNVLFKPHRALSNSLCEQFILPADEKDNRPDNFGVINVYGSLEEIFKDGSA